MNCQRIFSFVLLLVCILFAGPARAENAGEIKPKLIAVGSSEHVWALDAAKNSILYRRNPTTFRYDKIASNKAVTFIGRQPRWRCGGSLGRPTLPLGRVQPEL